MSDPPGAIVTPFYLNCSSDKACNVSENQKNYQDIDIHLHGTLKNNQGDFCNNETSSSEKADQKPVPEDGCQCAYHVEHEVSGKKTLESVIETALKKQHSCRLALMLWEIQLE